MREKYEEGTHWESEDTGSRKRKPKIHKLIIVLIVIAAFYGGYYVLHNFDLKIGTGGISEGVETFVEEEIIGTEGEVTTISEASLKKVFGISELQTSNYIYNAVTDVYDENEDDKTLKYHVAYEGTVTVGIDFSKIDITVDNDTKTININIPKVEIQDTIVNDGTLEYIFEKKKYDTEKVFKEAYAHCQEDLDHSAKEEDELLEQAQENARQVVEAMITPWVEQIDSNFTVVIE